MAFQIFESNHIPRFTGHETFHLRYGWLKKAYDAVKQSDSEDIAPKIFKDKTAIAHFGVGKNMVASIRHWAMSFGLIETTYDKSVLSEHSTTNLANFIFDNKEGVDPFLENLSTLWLLHWHLVTKSQKTTFLYAFNAFNEAVIDRERFLRSLKQLILGRGWGEVADATLQKDVSNLIGTYAVRRIDKRVSFEAVCHEPFSPGRAFLLSPQDLMHYISKLEGSTSGAVRWVESSGSRHIARDNTDLQPSFDWLRQDYVKTSNVRAA